MSRYSNEHPPFLSDLQIPSPVTESNRFSVGFAHTPGRKVNLEDGTHVMEDTLLVRGAFRNNQNEDLFAVFDGHDGSWAAELAAMRFHVIFEQEITVAELLDPETVFKHTDFLEIHPPSLSDQQRRVALALYYTFQKLKDELKNDPRAGGTTALVTFMTEKDLYVANVGDTRAVLCKKNGRAERISVDHKPGFTAERERIEASGGTVCLSMSVPRVEGQLSVSRALGDFDLEEKGVTWVPHIRVEKNFVDTSQFVILASDGLWDLVSENEAVGIVQDELAFCEPYEEENEDEGDMIFGHDSSTNNSKPKTKADRIRMMSKSAKEASESLVKSAFRKHAVDNISVIVVDFSV